MSATVKIFYRNDRGARASLDLKPEQYAQAEQLFGAHTKEVIAHMAHNISRNRSHGYTVTEMVRWCLFQLSYFFTAMQGDCHA